MARKGEYRKNCWGWKPEIQRAAEKQFYNNEPQEMRHKKKSNKKGKGRADHKHVYIDALDLGFFSLTKQRAEFWCVAFYMYHIWFGLNSIIYVSLKGG